MNVADLIKLLRHNTDLAAPIGVLVNDRFTKIKAVQVSPSGVTLHTEKWTYVRVLPARNGRFAVFARIKAEHEWVQVESISDAANANSWADLLEQDEEQRADEVASSIGEDWGDDAPAAPPQR